MAWPDIARISDTPHAAQMQFKAIPPLSGLVGALLTEVMHRDYDWVFVFSGGVSVVAESSHWRLIASDRVVITDEDDGQLFGLKEPVYAASVVATELSGASVSHIELSAVSDLLLSFSNGRTLQFLVSSGGYENWHVYGPKNSNLFAAGGGLIGHFVG